jgi:hypothetical protein
LVDNSGNYFYIEEDLISNLVKGAFDACYSKRRQEQEQ